MKLYVLSIEDGIVRAENENGAVIELLCADLPQKIYEGCVLIRNENGFVINEEETVSRKRLLHNKLSNLFSKNN